MKPDNWDQLPFEKRREIAKEMFARTRGEFIIGRALAIASEKLKESEPSDSQDMEILGEVLFSLGFESSRAFERK